MLLVFKATDSTTAFCTEESLTSMALHGVLTTYDTDNRLCYFESGLSANGLHAATNNSIVFVGGLGDGFNAISVLSLLSDALSDKGGWSLIQVLTRSSYSGWAMGDIDRDVEDLRTLEQHLRHEQGRKGKLVLLGHSTGRLRPSIFN